MLILGIDTSCDDTAASVVSNSSDSPKGEEDGVRIISNIVSGQTDIHTKYGGIVPELASRRHIEMIWPVVDEALKSADIKLEDLSAIAVCHGPGLIGSLLVGCSFAKALCFSKNIPLVAVNHLEGHVFSAFLEEPRPGFPFISLVASGGHTSLYRVDGFGRYTELGRTRDDAAGEAYDKVSKLLGLGYPGGPVIDNLAEDGNPEAINFPRAYLPESFDFSFSGVKTAVLHYVRAEERKRGFILRSLVLRSVLRRVAATENGSAEVSPPTHPSPSMGEDKGGGELINDIAASFQACVIDVLVRKTEWAIRKEGIRRVTLSGGVSANSELRRRMKKMGEEREVEIFIPSVSLCTDNAAMIAAAGFHYFNAGRFAGMDLNPKAYLPL
ncbi:MAG: tRNA (adenosine(37)-N6)-threonylcarbamoyltransferase complex transferase subunit TsaD [Thermodesulfovibrionales bacterium]|nr:tRNA (adenosine(37)-N6)-threonylcarbamoyltransferase complex transferase subunit TsaD [Thermodesulfovibrionales bacterium]MDP3112875.1 tRNA (adenosine(37)-N6)-threonylcarbamoyltransferase complex transferase subunit TsaD [Thermodesulfovibrionales bacterium]